MFVPRTIQTFGQLVQLFVDMKVQHHVLADRQVLQAGPLQLRWEPRHPFLHITQVIVTDVPADRTALVEQTVVSQNHDSQFPVLDFDARTRTVVFRVTTPVLVDGVRLDLLQSILAGIDVRVGELRDELTRLLA